MAYFSWDYLYTVLGIKDFIYFISSPSIQDALFPIKLVFIAFAIFFFCALVWFYVNSSYIKYQFLQDVTEFFSWETYGMREINRRWQKIKRRADTGIESEMKLALIEADDFLYETLQDMDYKGDTFEELLQDASRKLAAQVDQVLQAHTVRNAIVYDQGYLLENDQAKELLGIYETAIKSIAIA